MPENPFKKVTNVIASNPGDISAPKIKIVLVDDDLSVLTALRVVLARTYDVQAFTDPLEGAAAAAQADVRAVILDIMMPEYDGFWVFRKIRETNQRVPIIFNSAYQGDKSDLEIEKIYQPFAVLMKAGNIKEVQRVIALAVAT